MVRKLRYPESEDLALATDVVEGGGKGEIDLEYLLEIERLSVGATFDPDSSKERQAPEDID